MIYHVVSCSTGKDSDATLKLALNRCPPGGDLLAQQNRPSYRMVQDQPRRPSIQHVRRLRRAGSLRLFLWVVRMNYYEHHIGDYAEATAHLTFIEDAAYSRLIRKYYASERPLPAELKAVQRLVAARTKEEKEAVETILDEFFELRDDGWHNERCDEEIARFQDKQAKAKRSAESRWNKTKPHSEGNANASADGMRTHSEGNAHQSPVASRQSPDVNPPTVVAGSSDSTEGGRELPQAGTRKGLVCGLLRKAGMADAAPHHLTDETWAVILSKRTDEEIVEFAKAKMAARPGQRTGLKYIAPGLLEDPAPIAINGQGQPRLTQHQRNQAAIAESLFGPQARGPIPAPTEKLIEGEVIHDR